MCVRSSNPERTHPRSSRPSCGGPLLEFRVYVKRTVQKIDLGVRLFKVQARHELLVLQLQHRLDQPGYPGGRIQVPQVCLHGATRAKTLEFLQGGVERWRESRDLERVRQHGSRT